jgi:formylglycine-generating enzyme required for sulfatase activity
MHKALLPILVCSTVLTTFVLLLAACSSLLSPPTEPSIETATKNGAPCQVPSGDGLLPGTLTTSEWDIASELSSGMAVGQNGTVFVTINNSHRILGYDAAGQQMAEWEIDGEASALATGPGGQVYVTINNSHRVVGYSLDGQIVSDWLVDGQPTGLAVGAGGEIYVTINNSHRVVQYGPTGQIIQEWPVDGQPGGIAVGPGGEIYVTINNSHRVVQFSPKGEPLTEWNMDGQPGTLAVGPHGEVYVTINNSHRVVSLLPNHAPLAEWQLTGEAMNIAAGPGGQVYVTINNSHRIALFSCAPASAEQPPALAPINLAGPTAGAFMPWVDGSTLVYIPGGTSTMGDGGMDNPQTIVRLSDFWIYRTEVTNRMYALCVALGQCAPPADPQAANALSEHSLRDRPVTGVTWEQANAYCTWAQGRLPTESQWEKAARGEEGNIYPWGDGAPTCERLNFDNCTGTPSNAYDYPAGASFYDVLGMSGNVFEWVFDWYDPGYYTNDMEDPEGPSLGNQRSVRGGSFRSPAGEVLPSHRFFLAPGENRPDLGFRCVVINPQPLAPYCQTSAQAPGGFEPPAPAACDLSASLAGNGPGFATADLQGGTITSASAGSFDCSLASGSRVYCSGEAGETDTVTICGTCSGGEYLETGSPPELDCAAGYEPSVSIPNQCEYQGDGDPSGCPPDSYFETGLNRCAGGETSSGEGGNICATGLYFDTGSASCLSSGEPSLGCLPGYEFDAALGCCRAPAAALETPGLPNYPGCDTDEYSLPGTGCISSSTTTAGESSCVTLTLTIAAERPKDGGSQACVPSPSNCFCDSPCP